MPLDVELVGLEPLLSKVGELQRRLDGLQQNIPEELKDWEAEDMDRQVPWARQKNRGRRTYTVIRPHSAKSIRWRKAHQQARRAALRAQHHRFRRERPPSTRPILRAELFDRLCERMATLLRATITWS